MSQLASVDSDPIPGNLPIDPEQNQKVPVDSQELPSRPEYFLFNKDQSKLGDSQLQQTIQNSSASFPTGLIEKELRKAKVERDEELLNIEAKVRASSHSEQPTAYIINNATISPLKENLKDKGEKQAQQITSPYINSETIGTTPAPGTVSTGGTLPLLDGEQQQILSKQVLTAPIIKEIDPTKQKNDEGQQQEQIPPQLKAPRKSLNDKSFISVRSNTQNSNSHNQQQYLPLKIRTFQIVSKPSNAEQFMIPQKLLTQPHYQQYRGNNVSYSLSASSKHQHEKDGFPDTVIPAFSNNGVSVNESGRMRPGSALNNELAAHPTKSQQQVNGTNYFHSSNRGKLSHQYLKTSTNNGHNPFSNSLIQNSLQFDQPTKHPSQLENENRNTPLTNSIAKGASPTNPSRFFAQDQIIETNNIDFMNPQPKSAPVRRPVTAGGNLSISVGTNDHQKPLLIMYPRGYNKSAIQPKTETQNSSVMSGSEAFPMTIGTVGTNPIDYNQFNLKLSQIPFSTTKSLGGNAGSSRRAFSSNRTSSAASTPNLKMATTQQSMAQQYFSEAQGHFFSEITPSSERQIKLVEQKNFETNNIEKEKKKLDKKRVSSAKIYCRETQYLHKNTRIFQYIDMKTAEDSKIPEKQNYLKDSIIFKNYLNHASSNGISQDQAKFSTRAAASYTPNLLYKEQQMKKGQIDQGKSGKSIDFASTPLQTELRTWISPKPKLVEQNVVKTLSSNPTTSQGNKSNITRSIKKYACKFSAVTFEFGRLSQTKKLL